MSNTWFVSDHHLMHPRVLEFTDEAGEKIRRFPDLDTMNETIVKRHNQLVADDDLVYFGGDLIWKTNLKAVELLSRLKGRKQLIIGNHDNVEFLWKTGLFQQMYLWKYFPEHGFIFSHVPLVERDLRRTKANVHGHTHERCILRNHHGISYDPRYINVCVEQTGYRPIHLDRILERVKAAA